MCWSEYRELKLNNTTLIYKYMPLSQLGALRFPPLAGQRLALSTSRSPAPCTVPPLTARRLALFAF
eukprot:6181885-Pleurochrysis_carterae.AAC.1